MHPHFRLFSVLATALVGLRCEFSDTGKQYLLTRHNELRSLIALGKYVASNTTKESATNMMKIIWDEDLESSAQNYSSGCPSGHSTNRKDIGENMYWWISPADTETNMDVLGNRSSNLWQSEFQSFGWTENRLTQETFETGIGHASQMAWANTQKVGCGVTKCTGDSISGTEYVVVCQYSPAGNYIGSNIYKAGKTCSECPDGTSCESDTGLCV
ncbi:unnamed protein product [Caenorhabditis sp. 36 PRJEB53466]|nr:unnamed protein product [Caenorhabditis sp. 36 PRJEB53466]